MYLYSFPDDVIISANNQLEAIKIYKREINKTFISVPSHITDGILQITPNQMYGNLIFLFIGDLPLSLPDTAKTSGTNDESYAIDDADNWAKHWPNQVIEFNEVWGEQ